MTHPPQQPVEFVALWSAHSRRVYAYIYSLVSNWADADDIFQETSVVLIRKFDEFEPGSNFNAWACRVAYLKVLEALKQRRLREHVDELFLDAVHDDARVSACELDPRFAALTECLSKLPVKDRKLIEQRYRDDKDVKSMAERIGRSAALVYKSLSRIHQTLLECIRRRLAEGER